MSRIKKSTQPGARGRRAARTVARVGVIAVAALLTVAVASASACTTSVPSSQTLPIQDDGFAAGSNAPHITAITVTVDAACNLTLGASVVNRPLGPDVGDAIVYSIDTDNNPSTGDAGADWLAGRYVGLFYDTTALEHYPDEARGPDPAISGFYGVTFPINNLGVTGDVLSWNLHALSVADTGDTDRAPRNGMLPLTIQLRPPPPPPPPPPPAPPKAASQGSTVVLKATIGRQRFSAALSRGIAVAGSVTADTAVTVGVALAPATAHRLGLRGAIATKTFQAKAGKFAIKVPISRRARSALRRHSVKRLTVNWTVSAAGKRITGRTHLG